MCFFQTKLLIDILEKTFQNSGDEESAFKSPAQNQTSWLMLVIPTLRMLRQENCCELKSYIYIFNIQSETCVVTSVLEKSLRKA